MFDAEAAEQNAEISKKLNEDFKEGIREMHRDLLQEVRIPIFSKSKSYEKSFLICWMQKNIYFLFQL